MSASIAKAVTLLKGGAYGVPGSPLVSAVAQAVSLAMEGDSAATRVVDGFVKNRLSFFTPHPKQDVFLRSPARIRLFQGGNRSGKTTCGACEDAAHLLGCRPWLSKGDPHYYTGFEPPVKGRIVCEDFQVTAKNVIVPKLREWIPEAAILEVKKNSVGVETEWWVKGYNGAVSHLQIMTNEQDSDLFEGWDGHFVHYDEPPRREIYIACMRGLVDHGGRAWFSMTPLKEPWIYDEIYLKAGNLSAAGGRDDIFAVEVDTLDNVGYGLTQQSVDDFARDLSTEEREARLRGKYRHLSGLVYKEYDPLKHIVAPIAIPPEWPRYVSIDPHPRNPHAVVWAAISPRGELYVYDELYIDALIPELCRQIKAKTGTQRVVKWVCDPSAFNRSPMDDTCWADEFHRQGIPIVEGSKDLGLAIRLTKERWEGVDKVHPELFLFNTLSRLPWELSRYQWDEWSGKASERRAPRERPKDKDDHAIECLHRIVLCKPTFRDTSRDFSALTALMPSPDVC